MNKNKINQLELNGYRDPKLLIANLRREDHQLAAKIQYDGGARISEANNIIANHLKGLHKDPYFGQLKGRVEVLGESGNFRDIFITLETYNALKSAVEQKGVFRFDEFSYQRALVMASVSTEQDLKERGYRNLRWNFAQKRFLEIWKNRNFSKTLALKVIAKEMGGVPESIIKKKLGCRDC